MSDMTLDDARTSALGSRELVLAAGAGVLFDLASNGQRAGFSIPLFVLVFALAIRVHVRRGVQEDVLLGAAAVVGVFPALRATEMLVAMDLLAVAALFALAATHDEQASPTIESLLRRAIHAMLAALRVPGELLAAIIRRTSSIRLGRVRSILRATAIAGPILGIFALLLASSDEVFGDLLFFDLPGLDVGSAGSHVFLSLIGTAGAAALLLSAARPVDPGMPAEGSLLPRVRFGDLALVLGGIDALFALFVGVQFAVLFGGSERVEVTPGLTYAEYARSGFFQLIAVAALTVIVILGAWDMGRRADARQERWFRGLVSAMIGLCGVILASALTRLALYENTFGFTLNRLVGYVAIVFIGLVMLILLVAIWTGARARVVSAFLVAGLCTLLAVNIVNPERFVAERNLARYENTGKIDPVYLVTALGAEAVPALVDSLGELADQDRTIVRTGLCLQAEHLESEPGWRSANLGRARAAAALSNAGITEARCSSEGWF